MLEVRVVFAVLDLRNLVARVVSILKVCWRVEVEQGSDLIVTSVQFDKVLDCGEWLKSSQVIVRDINVDEILVLLNAL